MRIFPTLGLIALLFFTCDKDKPKINYQEMDTVALVGKHIEDTTKILIADLPVKFPGTEMRLIAIREVALDRNERAGKFGSDSYGSDSQIASAYFSGDELFGNFVNIVFQGKDGNERRLTDKRMFIWSVHFLKDVFEANKSQYLIYTLSDKDSNGDMKISREDIVTLYISNIDGSDFRKLTKNLHGLNMWNLTKDEARVYFRTVEDANKDGELNNNDNFHYYYVDLSAGIGPVVEYFPLKALE